MNAQLKQVQDAANLHRLNALREQRALRQLEQHRRSMALAEKTVTDTQHAISRIVQQRQALARDVTSLSSKNIERMLDARKLDKTLMQDQHDLQNALADAEAEYEMRHAQWLESRQQWQQRRTRNARLQEKLTTNITRKNLSDAQGHDQD